MHRLIPGTIFVRRGLDASKNVSQRPRVYPFTVPLPSVTIPDRFWNYLHTKSDPSNATKTHAPAPSGRRRARSRSIDEPIGPYRSRDRVHSANDRRPVQTHSGHAGRHPPDAREAAVLMTPPRPNLNGSAKDP